MNSEEFVNEICNSKYHYKGFEEEYKEFQKYQEITICTLQEIHKICEENNILYQMAFGSLLGLIRDNGQIPWDYDVDIMIRAFDRQKFIDAANKNLPDKYKLFCVENDKKCNHMILRAAPKNLDTCFLHVDIFLLAGMPKDEEKAKCFKKTIFDLTLLYKAKKYHFFEKNIDSKKEKLLVLKYLINGLFRTNDNILRSYYELVEKYPIDKNRKCCLADRFSEWYDFEGDIFDDTILFNSNIGEYRIPRQYDDLLKLQYGNYHSYPPLDKRLQEFKMHFNYLKQYCPISET